MDNVNPINEQNNNESYNYSTLMALVDEIIPRTPVLAKLYGNIMYYGALDLLTDEYITMNLKYYTIPLFNLTEDMRNMIVKQFILTEGITIISSLNRFTMLGYYSEWFGYGSTRLAAPNQRILEYNPLSWEQVSYPGPSFSYNSLVRQYYNIKNKK